MWDSPLRVRVAMGTRARHGDVGSRMRRPVRVVSVPFAAVSLGLASLSMVAPAQAAGLPQGCVRVADEAVCTYAAGSTGSFTIPEGVATLKITAVGGDGAGVTSPWGSVAGGRGRMIQAVLPVG